MSVPPSPFFRSGLTLVGALLLSALLAQTPLFGRLDVWFADAQQGLVARWHGQDRIFEQTLVVDIDEESLRRLEPYLGVWPYKRDVYALVLDYLTELGARKVCFDVLTSERRDGDAALAAAVARNPASVFAAVAQSFEAPDDARQAALRRLSWTLPPGLGVENWEDFSLPVVPLAMGMDGGVGIASLWPDSDGIVRRIPLFHQAQGATLPGLALAMTIAGEARPALTYDAGRAELRAGQHVWPVDAGGRVVLNFPSDAGAVPSIPFYALALAAMGAGGAAAFDQDLVAGRTVIIGSTALRTDTVNTPRGLLPGAYLLAIANANLSADTVLRPSDPLATAILLSLALLLPVAWSLFRPRTTAISVGSTLVIGSVLASAASLGLLAGWLRQSPWLLAQLALVLHAAGQFARIAVAELRRRQHAENQMRIAAAVFAASNEGIFVTDADNRIISINAAFTTITGYNEKEAIGQNPRLLSSNRHDADFYLNMKGALQRDGSWRGEIWNRRKNGEIFPEWMTISAIRNADGEVDKWVAILSDLSSNKAAEEKISFLAHYDPLTGLPNRVLLRDRVDVALAAAQREDSKLILMLIDLDRFKNVVDSLGHGAGDEILRQVAARLRALVDEGDTLSRYGGDEFMLLLPDTDAESAVHLAERILDAITQAFRVEQQIGPHNHTDHHELRLTASIGIAEFPENGGDYDALARSADSALYRAKQAGRGNFQFFADEMHRRAHELLLMENSLRHAVERDELVLHYQPKVDAATGRLTGLEALVRWQHPQRGLVPPAEFIPIAEESGQIREIGDWVLRRALAQMVAWRTAGVVLVPMAVNLSALQFNQPNLCQRLADLLQENDIAPELLELELTESVAMENSAFSIASIDALRQFGVGLSIDDFGTGYSSLAYLKRFAVNKIKIDHSFVRNLSIDKDDAAIVRAIISLAHNLGFTVVAEGVETAEQLAFLRRHGCDEIQGFYYCRPQPAGALHGLLVGGAVLPAVSGNIVGL